MQVYGRLAALVACLALAAWTGCREGPISGGDSLALPAMSIRHHPPHISKNIAVDSSGLYAL